MPKRNDDLFFVKISPADRPVTLSEFREVSLKVQQALNALARNLTSDSRAAVQFEIVKAEVGSFGLGLRPSVSARAEGRIPARGAPLSPARVMNTFASDLQRIGKADLRPDLSSSLARSYRQMVESVSSPDVRLEFYYKRRHVLVDEKYRRRFTATLRNRLTEVVTIAGRIEAMQVHRSPFTFFLYPKLRAEHRIECRFPDHLRPQISDLLKLNDIMRVRGRGTFAAVGLYPERIDVDEAPTPLPFNAAELRALLGTVALVPQGMTDREYVEHNRRAKGLAD